MKKTTKKTTLVFAIAALLGGTSLCLAGGNKGGASNLTPGDQMKDQGTKPTKGASEFSPGDRMKDSTTTPKSGASDFTPGDRMNDKRKK
jgi:hypothetical protein